MSELPKSGGGDTPTGGAAMRGSAQPTRFRRDRATWIAYLFFALNGFAINGLGSVLLPLQAQTGLSAMAANVCSSFFAVGLLVSGTLGDRMTATFGRSRLLTLAFAIMAAGAAVMSVPSVSTAIAGSAGIGLAEALIIMLLPPEFAERFGSEASRPLAEANGLASTAGAMAPLTVAAALTAGLGWQFGYSIPLAVLGVFAAGAAIVLGWGAPKHVRIDHSAAGPIPSPRRFWGVWADLVLSVAVEFCFLLWGASAIAAWHHVDLAQATLLAGAYLVGMALGRIGGARLTVHLSARRATLLSTGVATAGALVFWLAPTPVLASVGIFVGGLGVALLYPLAIARLIAEDPRHADRASSRGALGSGTAILLAPPALVAIAGATSLRIAFVMAPLLLVVLGAHVSWMTRRDPR